MIRAAHPSEARKISDLALRSKSHWGYTDQELAVFRGELTLTAEQIAEKRAHVLEESGVVVGFYTLVSLAQRRVELEHLFVDPGVLGRGIGSRLFRHACDTARDGGAEALVIQSDPNAAGFYQALGAKLERDIPSSIPGRTIPYFSYPLEQIRPG